MNEGGMQDPTAPVAELEFPLLCKCLPVPTEPNLGVQSQGPG